MLKRILFTLGLIITANVVLHAQGVLVGTITDEQTKEPLPFVNVIVEQNGEQKGGATTGMDGTYQIKPLDPGVYDIKASYVGYGTVLKKGVKVITGGFSAGGDIAMKQTSKTLDEITVTEYAEPLIEKGTATSGSRITSEQIEKMTANSVDGIIAQVGGISDNDGSAGSARGESQMQTYVGGAKKHGSVNVPKSAIQGIQVILGGTPAQYGEAIGGTTNITLKPPQNKFEGMVQYRTSEPFDTRGYHRPEFYLTGPIYTVTNKETGSKNTVIGFRLSGFDSYTSDGWLRPKDRYYYMAKDDVIAELEKNPLRFDPTTGSVQDAASYLKANDFQRVGRKSNLWDNTVYLEGGLDFRLSKNSSLKINGEYITSRSINGSVASMMLNNGNNSESNSNSYQITANFTQKISSDENSTAFIKNIMFDVLGSYEHQYGESYHRDFKDDYFRYGHIGTFRTYKRLTFALNRMDIDGDGALEYVYEQNGWLDYQVDYTPSNDNPGLAAYTTQLFTSEEFASVQQYLYNYDNIRMFGGLVNGDYPSSIYSMFTNVGVPASGYSKSEQNSIYASAKISADIGKHQVELGFQYDQQIYRSFSLSASSLWTLMKQEANQHILYRDLDHPIIDNSGYYPYVSYDRNYDQGSQTYFDVKLREALGLAVDGTEYIDIDSYAPSTFSLDMFSADELFNSGNAVVSYLGYDHTGKKLSGKTSLQDFFAGSNNGHRDLGAWQPIYMAGYIQDQFFFRDLVFNIGLRVDRFDGNQMGLKDPYLLYESYTAGELRAAGRDANSGIPNTIPDDAIVYVDKLSSTSTTDNVAITGFRTGEGSASTWYTANGEITSDPSKVGGSSGQPLPFRKGELLDTGLPKVISTNAFKDYEPQIVAMPRIAFSFPVSDQSEFKASYDIIARRPSSGYWMAGYANYLFMEKMDGAVLTNPNLKPEKITNYELGFQQVLNKNSALTISAYYKQTRDLIALVQYTGADPTNMYYSYDNQDFRTTKGLTIQYDLRRVKNIRAAASYTLQYAEGTTGLPSSTLVSLIRAGYPNVKMMFPIGDDRRHAFKLNLDFRYGDGDKYDGPVTKRTVKDKEGNERVKNIRWLQNFGVNLTGVVQSGAPYTKYYSNTQATIVGSYRGARLPWIYRVDLTLDKAFMIKVGKRQTMLDIFCSIYNVFNFKNITGVYGVTGDPDDNGYLTDPDTQTIIQQQLDEESYRNYYMMYLNNSAYNYSSPRRVEIGVSYQF